MKAIPDRVFRKPIESEFPPIESTRHGAVGYFNGYTLHSVFQPIYSFAHHAPVGYEALLRATSLDGEATSPAELFSSIEESGQLMLLEQLSTTLHVINFIREDLGDAWLFLNINPRLIHEGHGCLRQLMELLNSHEVLPSRIVVEFVEDPVTDAGVLKRAAQYLRQSGCLIAIDDFGTGHSSISRVWDLRPDIVKLDKSVLDRARKTPGLRRSLVGLVELLHGSGALVLMEGIEELADATMACDVDIDFHQGYFCGRPTRQLREIKHNPSPYLEHAREICRCNSGDRNLDRPSDTLLHLFGQCASAAHPDIPLEQSCECLLNHPYVVCCYLLDAEGYQVGKTVYGHHSMQNIDPRFRVLRNTESANWSRRLYLRRAISNPNDIQTTRPYLSLTGDEMCTTLSLAVEMDGRSLVMCCDVKWQDY